MIPCNLHEKNRFEISNINFRSQKIIDEKAKLAENPETGRKVHERLYKQSMVKDKNEKSEEEKSRF